MFYKVPLLFLMCFNKLQVKFCEKIMNIRFIAKKQKIEYQTVDTTIGSLKEIDKKELFPLFELIMKELKNEQKEENKGGQINE